MRPQYVRDHVEKKMCHVQWENTGDFPWWIKTSNGKVSIKRAWDGLRQKYPVNEDLKSI